MDDSNTKSITRSLSYDKLEENTPDVDKEDPKEQSKEMMSVNINDTGHELGKTQGQEEASKVLELESEPQKESTNLSVKYDKEEISTGVQKENLKEELEDTPSLNINVTDHELEKDHEDKPSEIHDLESKVLKENVDINAKHDPEDETIESVTREGPYQAAERVLSEDEEPEPVFDGTEVPGMEANRSTSTRSLDLSPETEGSAWPEKAVALKNFVKDKSAGAVTSLMRRLSGKRDDLGQDVPDDNSGEDSNSPQTSEVTELSRDTTEKSAWNPLSYINIMRDTSVESKADHAEKTLETSLRPIVMKGRIILYTRLGCQECRKARLYFHRRRLRYVEINIDVYPSRKLELEKIAGSSAVPQAFFNEVLIGGLNELERLDETGKLDEKIARLIIEAPSLEAPLSPLSGEDDLSNSGQVDEFALIVRKMKHTIIVKDRFYKMRRFSNCFLGSEAVDFLAEDQYLEKPDAIEFGRKLASKLFFRHVIDDNLFEDGNHLYRFLDDDPTVTSQCHNIPLGITDVKPKPITEIASRLRLLCCAIFEAYTSEDGKHVDYRSIHGSEEFARYLRIIQELHRVELVDMLREEKLAFFINLYNMMAIHAILVWGYPAGPLERRKMFGNFKYVIGGTTYSLSAIQNGILRANQRPPYNIMKPFGTKDKRVQVALPYPEPLIHFALVFGSRSGPALRCYSPADIDKELMEATQNYLRSGFFVDFQEKVVSVPQILKWFSVDFGKNEVEVLKHVSNYLEPSVSEAILELLASAQLKITYHPYDWGLNY